MTILLPQLSTATPLVNGTPGPGTSTNLVREDHVHPVDTSRAAAADLAATNSIVGTHTSQISSLQGTVATAEQKANKGVASGYAGLDATAKVPLAQLPASVIGSNHYIGTWNASTNTPALASGASSAGVGGYYIVSTAGTTTLDGLSVWGVGDWAVFNGTVWEKLDGQANPVSSVAGRQGAVVLAVTDVSGALPSNGGTATGLILSSDPVAALGAATKQYVDAHTSSTTSTFTTNSYTASGAIAPTDDESVVNASSTVTMTLAAGAATHLIAIKRLGVGAVVVSASIDGTSQSVSLNAVNPPIKECLTLRYNAAFSTWLAE